jgi:uncharacterized membrane protein
MAVGFTLLNVNTKAASALVLTGMVIFMGNYGLTVGGVVFMLIAEMVEPKYVSYSLGMIWFSVFIISFLFPIITTYVLNDNPAALFYIFTGWVLVSFLINSKYLV